MTSFKATFGLTRSIGGWEEGERRERNKRKRQPGRTGAGQRREWQLNEQRQEINIDIEERKEIQTLKKERNYWTTLWPTTAFQTSSMDFCPGWSTVWQFLSVIDEWQCALDAG